MNPIVFLSLFHCVSFFKDLSLYSPGWTRAHYVMLVLVR